jgi:hypothetical protein
MRSSLGQFILAFSTAAFVGIGTYAFIHGQERPVFSSESPALGTSPELCWPSLSGAASASEYFEITPEAPVHDVVLDLSGLREQTINPD